MAGFMERIVEVNLTTGAVKNSMWDRMCCENSLVEADWELSFFLTAFHPMSMPYQGITLCSLQADL